MEPYLEITLRAIGAFFGLLLVTRILGKEQMGQLTASDFANAIAIGSIAAEMASDHKENVMYYIIAIVIFGGLTYLSSLLSLKFRPVRKLLEGEPIVVVQNGKILEKNMRKERYDMDNLIMQLREKNVFHLSDVEFAVLEPNGKLSVLLKSNRQPLTASDLNISTQYQGLSSEIIVDGKVIIQNLEMNGLNQQWLYKQLDMQGIDRIEEVSLASLDTSGKLYIDKYADDLQHNVRLV
ncbi:DUF421 domain-containing protein [Desulfotomaculum sp. 1211_IL3151]|uniref:DUF421 domain-containing protein n=1 Tax=Desulfotomaculum sp. 1211_IL3151 TaxID=3084055 RepID=UPI002FDB6506